MPIIGADSLVQFTGWKRYEEIPIWLTSSWQEDRIPRTGAGSDCCQNEGGSQCENFRFGATALDFSSTRIRNRIRGLSIRYMVPECGKLHL